ncbi:hypothetical protein ACP70R_044327 [Stipagrostis hirtigluma subsp. patula]
MDRQSMQGGGAGGGGHATQEYLYAGGGGQPEQVVDGAAFLMELLEEAPAGDQPPEDVDRLSRVMRSLEAEIGADSGRSSSVELAPAGYGESTAEYTPRVDVDGGLEDMLLELDGSPGTCVAEAPFEYWAEVPAAVGHDVGGWYIDGDAVMVGYEFREQCYYGYGESPSVEQVYSPLWE